MAIKPAARFTLILQRQDALGAYFAMHFCLSQKRRTYRRGLVQLEMPVDPVDLASSPQGYI